jgi:four helix bundle protein
MKIDIRDRAKKFGIRIIELIRKFPKDLAGQEIGRQLIRSGTSIGANLEEADAFPTRNDFFNKVSISYKEARESRYWLEIILESKMLNNPSNVEDLKSLVGEAVEISKILYSIFKGKNKKNNI